MEVHPPHEPVHSWRDALVHLGIVTVGLFIALSLEAIVDYVHHRELVHAARENIRVEMDANRKSTQFDLAQVDPNTQRIQNNIAALQKIEADPKLQPPMAYDVRFSPLRSTAWNSARDTGALSYMPYAEVEEDAELYALQDRVNDDLTTIYKRESESLGPVISASDYRTVPTADLQFAVRENGIALVDLYNLKQLLGGLDEYYGKTLNTR